MLSHVGDTDSDENFEEQNLLPKREERDENGI